MNQIQKELYKKIEIVLTLVFRIVSYGFSVSYCATFESTTGYHYNSSIGVIYLALFSFYTIYLLLTIWRAIHFGNRFGQWSLPFKYDVCVFLIMLSKAIVKAILTLDYHKWYIFYSVVLSLVSPFATLFSKHWNLILIPIYSLVLDIIMYIVFYNSHCNYYTSRAALWWCGGFMFGLTMLCANCAKRCGYIDEWRIIGGFLGSFLAIQTFGFLLTATMYWFDHRNVITFTTAAYFALWMLIIIVVVVVVVLAGLFQAGNYIRIGIIIFIYGAVFELNDKENDQNDDKQEKLLSEF